MSSVVLPRAIQQQSDDADALIAEMNKPQDEPAVQPEPPAQPEPQLQPVAQAPQDNWETRYKSLQGKYDSEVPHLHQQLGELRGQYSHVVQQAQRLEEVISQLQSQSKPFEVPDFDVVGKASDEEVQLIGEDTVKYVERATKQAIAAATAAARAREEELQKEVIQLRGKLGHVEQDTIVTRNQAFLDYIDRPENIPFWRSLNNDPKILEWLAQPDVMTGIPRQKLLTQAREAFDAERVIAIWREAKKATYPDAPPADQAQKKLEKHVAPDTNAPSVSVSNQVSYITEADIQAFYTAVRKGEIVGEAKLKREKEIDAAVAEGRYRP